MWVSVKASLCKQGLITAHSLRKYQNNMCITDGQFPTYIFYEAKLPLPL